eukprot:119853-Chlamydomonas_euryale.AAC.2
MPRYACDPECSFRATYAGWVSQAAVLMPHDCRLSLAAALVPHNGRISQATARHGRLKPPPPERRLTS